MRYTFVQDEVKSRSVDVLCEAMEVSRSGYYAWLNHPINSVSKIINVAVLTATCKYESTC